MADLITQAQLTARMGQLDADEAARAPALITDASWLVRDIVHDDTITDSWDAAVADTVPGGIVPVVVSIVRRSLRNPDGFESESQQGYSYRGVSTVGVFASPAEANAIAKALRRGSPRSIDLSAHLPIRGRWT